MPRPRKCRRVCSLPQTSEFVPVSNSAEAHSLPAIIMTIDEYETLRLIDKEGISQEECSEYMNIARTTVTQIYASARKKLADALIDGIPLKIEGGDYQLCDGSATHCLPRGCYKSSGPKKYAEITGGVNMRIAVTYENGQIFQHFGHTQQFKVYQVEDGKVVDMKVVDTNGSGHGALAGVLLSLQADVLICGGIGGGAQNALAAAGIQLFGGVAGDADAAVAAYLAGELAYNPNVQCNHHDHHHGEDHTCGSHGCGSHTCGHH